MEPPTQEQEVRGGVKVARQVLDLPFERKGALDRGGQMDEAGALLRRQPAAERP